MLLEIEQPVIISTQSVKLCLTWLPNKASSLAARAGGVVLAMWESLQNPAQK